MLNTRLSNASMLWVHPYYCLTCQTCPLLRVAWPIQALAYHVVVCSLACLSCRQIRLYLPGLGTGLGPEDEEPAEKASSSGKSTAASA